MSDEYGSPNLRRTYIDESGDEVVLPDVEVFIANVEESTLLPHMEGVMFDEVSPRALNARPAKKSTKKGAVKRVS